MITRKRRPSTPGQILLKHHLEPNRITVTRFAKATTLSNKHVSQIIHGHAALSPETAIKFAAVLGTTPELWINLQRAVDLWDARQKLKGWKPAEALHGAA